MHYYILKDRRPVRVESVSEWSRQLKSVNRRIAWTDVGEAIIATSFICVDHHPKEPPLLFQTGICFNPGPVAVWDHQTLYATWEEAVEGHERAVAWVRSVTAIGRDVTKAMLEKLGGTP
jgi:hypothetical protein